MQNILSSEIPLDYCSLVREKVVACAKHFVGDGGTHNGIDENNTIINRDGLFSIHMPAYYDSIIKGISTVMVSYSSWNGVKMHANQDLVSGYLKNGLRFRVCSSAFDFNKKRFMICGTIF